MKTIEMQDSENYILIIDGATAVFKFDHIPRKMVTVKNRFLFWNTEDIDFVDDEENKTWGLRVQVRNEFHNLHYPDKAMRDQDHKRLMALLNEASA